ncbi:glycosyltransferase family 39 protein [Cyanobium sp. WAJ14-Wanaka]|uniref:ArnT family glycosyltransferase n=1 Tax=Cyanobium sp. WAJ14-Wanaka TaxID=2823725 RepID=UPI0020CD4EF1|nr:glycosyltransferase family 39 protein [Cyanobium sp. WAJ14-Wanaka]MCP9774732.1 glycosyltransferase family 39 protein [Cyanobium sp. WAJ14-Wanaka]
MINSLGKWCEVEGRRPALAGFLALLGLCILVFWNQLGSLGLMDKTEGLFVEIPRQMLLSGDWITPRWNGETFFDYPVWGYWMVALSFRVFGVTEWAARCPTALSATVTVLALFGVVLRLGSREESSRNRVGRATLAGTLLALSPGWIGWARASVTDMFLASAISLALLGFLLAYLAGSCLNQRKIGHVTLALFCGIAVMAKGPVGLLLPGLVIIGFLFLKGQLFSEIRATPWIPLVSLFLGVTLPWYVAATQANGWEFLQRFIGYSNFQRFTSVLYSHPGPPWFYLPWLLLLMLPWSLFLPVALVRLRFWQLSEWRQNRSESDVALFAVLWITLIFLFFSLASTKLPGYILPVLPAGALTVSLLFQPFQPDRPFGRGLVITGWINSGLLAVSSLAIVLLPRFLRPIPDFPNFNRALLSALNPVAISIYLALLSGAIIFLSIRPGRLPFIWVPNAVVLLSAITFSLPLVSPIVDRERLKPVRELARIAGDISAPDQPIVVVGFKRYSSIFYSNRSALFVRKSDQVFEAYIGKQAALKNEPEFDSRSINSDQSVLVLGTGRELKEFGFSGEGFGLNSLAYPYSISLYGETCSLIARRSSHLLIRCPLQVFFKH